MMSVTEILQNVQFIVDAAGNKKAVLLDYSLWEELLTQLEDLEDAEEIRHLRKVREEVISWEQAKGELRAEGVDV
jgi:PHD/YefM family antitoxin component YafN of YafNO toxin-antitoxin module